MFKKIISVILSLVVFYFIVSVGWSVLNTQTCSMNDEDKKSWPCEQIAKNNSENCHYVIMKWKKVNYEKELKECQSWQLKNK